MQKFVINIEIDALHNIQEITDWYNVQLKGFGGRFQKQLKSQINALKSNPHLFTILYNEVRCMVIKKFLFLTHYKINEKQSIVKFFAIYHTSRNPEI